MANTKTKLSPKLSSSAATENVLRC